MSHTNPWNITDPPGTEQAKNIDDHFRKLRLDIQDRAADIVVDVMADPWVLKRSALEPSVGETIKMISYADFKTTTVGKEAVYQPGVLTAFTDTDGLYANIDLPIDAEIIKIEVMADAGDATNVTWSLYNKQFVSGGVRPSSHTPNSLFSKSTVPGSGVQIIDSGAISFDIAPGYVYYMGVESSGPDGKSFDLFGVRITYTPP